MKYITLLAALALIGCSADVHRHDAQYTHTVVSKSVGDGAGLIHYVVWQQDGGRGGYTRWIIITDQNWELGDRLTIQAHKPNIEK